MTEWFAQTGVAGIGPAGAGPAGTGPAGTGPAAGAVARTRRPRVAAAVLVAGAVGALTLPLHRVGIGWCLTGLAVAAAVASVRLTVGRRSAGAAAGGEWPGGAGAMGVAGRGDLSFRAAMGAAAIALLGVGGVRAAEWLFALCLVAALATGSYALAGGGAWGDLLRAAVVLPLASARAVWSELAGPRDRPGAASPGAARPGAGPARWRLLLGVAIGVGLLWLFGALFRTADPAFAELLRSWTPAVSTGELVRGAIAALLVSGLVLGGVRLLLQRPVRGERAPAGGARPAPAARPERTPTSTDWLEWGLPLLMLDVLFGAFAYVQLGIVFQGHTYVLGPGGPTYAGFARTGFTQLLVVTVLTLGIFAVLARWAGTSTAGRRALLRLLGGALGVFTLLVVASAVRRVAIYGEAYGFTRPRLLADALEAWLGLVFVCVLLAGVRLRATWLPRAALAAGVVVLLGVAVLNPDAYIAGTVIERFRYDGHLDAAYLATLSVDAIPQINTLPDAERSCILARARRSLAQPDPWYAWNAGRATARATLQERPPARCQR